MKSTVHGYRVEFVENVNMIFKKTFLLMPLNFDHHIHAEEKALNFNRRVRMGLFGAGCFNKHSCAFDDVGKIGYSRPS